MPERKDFFGALEQALIPRILIVVIPTTILGFAMSGNYQVLGFLAGLLVITCIDLGGNALNNYADWGIDEKNKKRLLMHRTFSKSTLLLITALLFLLPLPFLLVGNVYLQISMIIGYFIAFNYSVVLKAKDRLFLNYAFVAMFYGPMALVYGYFASTADPTVLYHNAWILLFIFLIDMGFVVTKDYEDVEGDKFHGKKTLPSVFGKSTSLLYQRATITITFLIPFILVLMRSIGVYFVLALVSYPIAMFALSKVERTEDKKVYDKYHNMIRKTALLTRFILAGLFFFSLT